MRLAIFGATGRTGMHLLRQALEKGHQVTVLARDPAKLGMHHDRLVVIQGALSSPTYVEQVVANAEVVLSTLGPTSNRPVYEISQGMQYITDMMIVDEVNRIIMSAGAGVGDPADTPKLANRLIHLLLKMMAKHAYEDMAQAVSLVRGSGLDWTVVRAPMLTDAPGTGQVKVGMVGKGTGMRISRADLADFMLRQVECGDFIGKAPVISN